jgi:hypothetical protein
MDIYDIYHRYSTAPDKDVPLRDPALYPGDVAAIGNYRPLIVRDGKWVGATRAQFDDALKKFECIK